MWVCVVCGACALCVVCCVSVSVSVFSACVRVDVEWVLVPVCACATHVCGAYVFERSCVRV